MRISDWSSDVCSSDLDPATWVAQPRQKEVDIAPALNRNRCEARRVADLKLSAFRRVDDIVMPLRAWNEVPDEVGDLGHTSEVVSAPGERAGHDVRIEKVFPQYDSEGEIVSLRTFGIAIG